MTNAAYKLALTHLGTKESPGAASNAVIEQYFKDAGHGGQRDEVPWCAAFMGAMLVRTGGKGTSKLTARSYLEWGEPVDRADAREGDVVIYKRGNSAWQGHVGFFVKDNGTTITTLGGNQSDAVTRQAYQATALLGIRRAKEAAPVPRKTLPPLPPAVPVESFWAALVRALAGIWKGK